MSNPKPEIVVTGVNGFVGEHLAQRLQESDFSVTGVGREEDAADAVAPYLDSYHQADLLQKAEVDALPLSQAAAIIHLAGLASVADSFKYPELYREGNASMTENVLDAARKQGFNGRVVAISTGALYDTSSGQPVSEETPTLENSPYATGKLKAEAVAKKYRNNGLDVVIARPFNHIGPGQAKGFLVSDLYNEISAAKERDDDKIFVGNLETRRDYTDVRDIVKAYVQLATHPSLEHDTYNVASGKSFSGLDIFHYLTEALDAQHIQPLIDPQRVRPTDIQEITGDASRLQTELGWSPERSIEQAVKDFVERQKKS